MQSANPRSPEAYAPFKRIEKMTNHVNYQDTSASGKVERKEGKMGLSPSQNWYQNNEKLVPLGS